jgi:uncharacterized repeat protein (TIGR03803 family)
MSFKKFLSRTATVAALACAPLAAKAGTLDTLYSFTGGTDGGGVYDRLALRYKEIYGTTNSGGATGDGTIFQVDPKTGAETVLYSFAGGADGANPQSHLTLDKKILYGVTTAGGTSNAGTIFSFNPKTKKEVTLYSFTGGADGSNPVGGLAYASGYLWGVCTYGGVNNNGTVFKIDVATGAETTVYSFAGGSDGAQPVAAPIYIGGVFYGTTVNGGAGNTGTVYSVNATSGAEAVLYSFQGGTDGNYPFASLIYEHGYLFGTTYAGGSANSGTVFYYNLKAGKEDVVYTFTGGADGAYPTAGLAYGNNIIYGTASEGGAGYGTIFSIDAYTLAEATEYTFTGGADGAYPRGDLTLATNKKTFYGSTAGDNQSPYFGTVFSYTP